MYSLDVLLNIAFFHDEKQLFLFTIPVLPTASAVHGSVPEPWPKLGSVPGMCHSAAGAGRDSRHTSAPS